MAQFNTIVKAQVTTSASDIYNAYGDMVKCEQDTECCEYDDSVVNQHLERITQWKREIWGWTLDIARENVKLEEIANECPVQWEQLEAGKDLVTETKADRAALQT